MGRLHRANLAARPTKCLFGTKSVDFLGHLVGDEWITVNDENLEEIRHAKRPTMKREVRLFLGLANYYRDHIPSFAAISAVEWPDEERTTDSRSVGRSAREDVLQSAEEPA